jgi:hypothetical protein
MNIIKFLNKDLIYFVISYLQSSVEEKVQFLNTLYGFIVNTVTLERFLVKFPLPVNILPMLYTLMSCSTMHVT